MKDNLLNNNKGDKMYYQQGDVLVGKLDKLPEGLTKLKTNILQEGEFTGHAHRLDLDGNYEVFEAPATREKYLRILEPVALRHDEHKPITIAKGDYVIGIVEEYDPFSKLVRPVVD